MITVTDIFAGADGISTVALPHWYTQAAEIELDEPTPDRRTDV